MSIEVYCAKAFRDELKGVIRDIRVTWLLEELGLEYHRHVLDPMKGENKSPEYLKINPTGKVPTLVDGEFTLFESGAICEYLSQKHQRFMPQVGSKDYHICKQWNLFVSTNLEPQTGRIFSCDYFMEPSPTTMEIRTMALEALPRLLTPLDRMLSTQDFMMGNEFTITDIILTTTLSYLKDPPIWTDYPHLKSYYEKCTSRPAYLKAASENGAGW